MRARRHWKLGLGIGYVAHCLEFLRRLIRHAGAVLEGIAERLLLTPRATVSDMTLGHDEISPPQAGVPWFAGGVTSKDAWHGRVDVESAACALPCRVDEGVRRCMLLVGLRSRPPFIFHCHAQRLASCRGRWKV